MTFDLRLQNDSSGDSPAPAPAPATTAGTRWRSPQDWLGLCNDPSALRPVRHLVRLGQARRTATLRLSGVTNAELLRVDVVVAGTLVFSLRSDIDGRGGLLPAGELLAAIAVMFGRHGLAFDVSLPREPASMAEVILWLTDAARPDRVQVDVVG
jgi:hypothetical protein